MKLSINLLSVFILFNSLCLEEIFNMNFEKPRMIDAYTLVYEKMYSDHSKESGEYIILDMESLPFTNTTYEERQNTIQYFKKKYDKKILNSSLFRLQQIELADRIGNLNINGQLLMITNISSNEDTEGIIVNGINYISPVSARLYTIKLDIIDEKWIITSFHMNGIA
ncbi:hypothetical protein [Clostridium tarantellae]|uniref:Uncharacterized protein n=1 Tax=Clostridium tarantellae TaxID=39493 RepID=A0A6I1MXR7_9CLOT|nr:hypothetical protein [Clostridium tarantellae]MPQ44939.1 hypothetical protein [Clostridium tarantellae]